MFDTFIIVDWSAANQPRNGRDSIWICRHGETPANPRTRHEAKALLGDWLEASLARCERVLVGFDFPFGYPAGFSARLGLSGPPWRAIWDEIARLLKDDERNRNNRFEIAADFNQRVSNGPFPFWGCPAGKSGPFLKPTFHRAHHEAGLAERRLIDRREYMPGAQPCWKLSYAGCVGSQALTGIPVVRALRDDPRWRQQACVWPFETGLAVPANARFIFAEVYPSLWRHGDEKPKDKAQVLAVGRYFAERNRAGDLGALFAGDPELTREQRACVETEEAWTLGVTRRNQRSLSITPPRNPPVEPGERREGRGRYTYMRDPAEIGRRSLELIRKEADLGRLPRSLQPLALRLAQAAGDTAILGDLAWSRGAVAAGRRALAAGAPILVDARMVAAGIGRERLAAGNNVICTLPDAVEPKCITRSAAAVELWREHLAGAVVAIGNAPTALFRLLEIIAEGAPKPALVLGFPVGFVGAAEAKAALAAFGRGIAYITLHGRRGGSALAVAAVNALASTG